MATEYEAIVRVRPAEIGDDRTQALADLVRSQLPPEAAVATDRSDGDLRVAVSLRMTANDASEVQIAARDLVAEAITRAGLTEQAALLDDVTVKAGS